MRKKATAKKGWESSPLARSARASLALLEATQKGDVAGITKAIEGGAELRATSAEGTALHIAADRGDTEALTVLLDAGTPIDEEADGAPLARAAANGHLQAVRLLLDRGAEVGKRSEEETAIERAARAGHEEIVEVLIEHGAPLESAVAAPTRTAIVRRLLEAGADPDAEYYHSTALAWAVERGDCETARILIDAGADKKRAVESATTAEGLALLGDDAPPQWPLHLAARCNAVSLVQQELQSGRNVDEQNSDGHTPLMLAARYGALEATEGLVSAGAKRYRVTEDIDDAALVRAAENGHGAVLLQLLDEGVPQDQLDGAVMALCCRWTEDPGREDPSLLVEQLLDRGASPNANRWGQSALAAAAEGGYKETVRLLLDRGADAEVSLFEVQDETIADLLIAAEAPPLGLLLNASTSKNLGRMKRALEHCRIDERNEQGDTPILCAARAGYDAGVTWLLERGAKIDAANEDGSTALSAAAQEGHTSTVRLLLDCGAKTRDSVRAAASDGHMDIALLLLDAGADINASKDSHETALIHAAERDDAHLLELLLKRSAAIDQRNIIDHTALMQAASLGSYVCAQMLVAAGAQMSSKPGLGSGSALAEAIDRGHDAVAVMLLEQGAGVRHGSVHGTPLMKAAERGSTALIRALLEAGARADEQDSLDRTPLRAAAKHGHLEAVRVLLDAGAAIVECYESPLTAAAAGGHHEIVELLIEHGAKVDANNLLLEAAPGGSAATVALALDRGASIETEEEYAKRRPLHLAAGEGHLEVIALLLDRGAMIDECDEEGHTPIAFAEDRRQYSAVRLLTERGAKRNVKSLVSLATEDAEGALALIEQGVNVNVRGALKRTALMEAAASGQGALVNALLEAAADVNAVDEDGWTALMEAADAGDAALVRQLIEAGADPFLTDERSFTAMKIAEDAGCEQVVEVLQDLGADHDRRQELFEAIGAKQVDRVRALLAAGLPSETVDAFGRSALLAAVQSGDPDLVDALASEHPDLDAPLYHGGSALSVAAQEGSAEVVARLLALGARVDWADEDRMTPLHHAAGNRHAKVASLLVGRGAMLEVVDNEERTPLMVALDDSAKDVAEVLLEAGAQVTEPTLVARALESDLHRTAEHIVALGGLIDLQSYPAYKLAKRLIKRGGKVGFADPTAGIHLAAEDSAEMVVALLEAGSAVDARDESGSTALHLAAGRGKTAVVKALIDASCDVHAEDEEGCTAVMEAASAKKKKIVELLAAAGADLTGCIAHLAAADVSITKAFIDLCHQHGDAIDAFDPSSDRTALMEAAAMGNEANVKRLLAAGADPGVDVAGQTALGLAASGGYSQIVRQLIEAGTPDVRNQEGWSTLMHVARMGNLSVVKRLLAEGFDARGCLIGAAASGKLSLLEHCAVIDDPNARDEAGWSAAMYAAEAGHAKALSYLLERSHGAGITLAAVSNEVRSKIVQRCIKQDPDINWRDQAGQTALMLAVGSADVSTIRKLIDAGAEVDAQDEDGETALMLAAEESDDECCSVLLDAGADRTLTDSEGRTAFDYISETWSSESEVLEEMLQP